MKPCAGLGAAEEGEEEEERVGTETEEGIDAPLKGTSNLKPFSTGDVCAEAS